MGEMKMDVGEMFRRAERVLVAPDAFFTEIHDEGTLFPHWLYYVVLSGLMSLLTILFSIPAVILGSLFQGLVDPASGALIAGTGLFFLFALYIGGFIVGLGLIFVSGGLIHLLAMLFGSREPYVQSFKLACYASTPFILLAPFELLRIIPLAGDLIYFLVFVGIGVYYAFIMVKGGVILHKLSTMRSVMAFVVVPIAVIAAVVLLILLIVAVLAFGFIGTMFA